MNWLCGTFKLYDSRPYMLCIKMVGEGRGDLLVDGRLVVELKAVESLGEIHAAQVVAYLKSIDQHLGLLINFNVPVLRQGIKRIIH